MAPATRLSTVAELLALALLRRQQRVRTQHRHTVDDALTLSRTRAFIGPANPRGGRIDRHDPAEDPAAIVAADYRD